MSGTSRARLDLVEDEDGAELVAEVAQALQETFGGNVHAALARDGLDQDGRSLGAGHLPGGFEVTVRGVDHAWEHGSEACLEGWLGGGGEAAVGAAVEGLCER